MKTRKLVCCCCGADAGRWRQHWNRDTGFGVCSPCVDTMRSRGTSDAEIADLYGTAGINWGPAPMPGYWAGAETRESFREAMEELQARKRMDHQDMQAEGKRDE